MLKKNFYLLTGGPGSGKTTVLKALQKLGYSVVAEAGRKIIQAQLASDGRAIHTKDQIGFRELMFKQSLNDYVEESNSPATTFFNRGLPDLIGYSKLIEKPLDDLMRRVITEHHYNPQVFLFTPWEAIYTHDNERKQDFKEAVATYKGVKEGYIELGYTIVEMPNADVAARTHFIVEKLGQYDQN